MDKFDLKIISVWQERGDIGPVEMAQIVPLSPSQCSRRMQQLQRAGYIRAIRAVLDAAKVNVKLSAYVLLTMKDHSPAAAKSFYNFIKDMDEVVQCQKLTGSADMIVKVETRDLSTFNHFLSERLLSLPEVSTGQSSIILEDLKSTSSLPTRFVLNEET